MPTCGLCANPFPNRMEIEGKIRNVSSRKMCLTCSPWGQRNTLTAQRMREQATGLFTCNVCKEPLPSTAYTQRSDGIQHPYCKPCDARRSKARARQFKQDALLYKGSKCVCCGYSRCPDAMAFHHRDPAEKDFTISARYTAPLSEEIKAELDKCELVCVRCHVEVHVGIRTL